MMGLLGVLGVIAIVFGFLGLFHAISFSMAVSVLLIVVGLLLVVFTNDTHFWK